MIPSTSTSSANSSGVALKASSDLSPRCGSRFKTQNILRPMRKHRSCPHFTSSSTCGSVLQYLRMASRFMRKLSRLCGRRLGRLTRQWLRHLGQGISQYADHGGDLRQMLRLDLVEGVGSGVVITEVCALVHHGLERGYALPEHRTNIGARIFAALQDARARLREEVRDRLQCRQRA